MGKYREKLKQEGGNPKRMEDAIMKRIKGHEKDFLVAHRTQMMKVKHEMHQIKEASSDRNLQAIRDYKLQKLEKEQKFFQNEAFQLDKKCKKMEDRLKDIKLKVDELEDDRDFHQAQLTKIMRLNTAIQKYIEQKSQQLPLALPAPESEEQITQEQHALGYFPITTTSGSLMTPHRIMKGIASEALSLASPVIEEHKGRTSEVAASRTEDRSRQMQEAGQQVSGIQEEEEFTRMEGKETNSESQLNGEQLRELVELKKRENEGLRIKRNRQIETVKHLRKQLEAEQKISRQGDVMKGRSLRNERYELAEESNMKKIFLKAIESVKSKIKERGGPKLTLEGFTAHDKRLVIEEMLNDDETLFYVYKSLCEKG